jgi:hypothetical protein
MKKIPLLFCLVLACAGVARAQSPTPTPECTAGRGGAVYSRGGEVTVEIMAGNPAAIFTSEIRLLSPAPVRAIGSSRATGATVNLGTVPEGTELVFGIFVNDSITPGNFLYSTGPAARNPDGVVHADVACAGDGVAVVSFEDGNGGGDMGFNDVIFRVRTAPLASIQSVLFEGADAPLDGNPQEYGGGRRIFPDATAPGGQPQRAVRVRVRVTPPAENVNVYLRSLDVDDSSGLFKTGHGADNLGPQVRSDGFPREGRFDNSNAPQVTLQTDANGEAVGTFNVTMQPGDNFRVAAATRQEVAGRLVVNDREVRDPQNNRALAEETAAGQGGDPAVMSQLLTVWRKLHVEVDSMDAPPASDQAPERNFIAGTVTAIAGSNSEPERLTLADSTAPPVPLRDRSPDLDGANNPNFARQQVGRGNGRFERGAVRLGDGAGAVNVTGLDGNGLDYVRKENGMRIPFRLADRDGNNVVPAGPGDNVTVTAMDQGRREFSLNVRLGRVDYAGGTLTVAGVTFNVTGTQNRNVTVQETPALPFNLTDDDQAQWPFLSRPPAGDDAQGGTPFAFMQTSDNRARNLYAPAYVKPVYDLDEGAAPFDRNVETREQARQVSNGQNAPSSPDYWVVYLQGAFQPTTFIHESPTKESGDADPAGEVTTAGSVLRSAELGFTSAVEQTDGSLTNIGGSTVYVETIRDAAQITGFTCLQIVPIHESGHQWGLTHPTSSPGIMGPCVQNMDRRFIDAHQRAIRQRRQPQGN